MGTDRDDGHSAILERTREFVVALKAMPVVQHFAAAEQRFRTDPEVQRILGDLQKKVEIFQRAQEAGTLRTDKVRAVREAQARFQGHPLVQEFFQAREAAGLFLQETNRVISGILGLDFGQTVGPAGGAC